MTTRIEQDIKTITQALGIETSDIKVIIPDWLKLMRQGVIVNIHLSRWRATTRLTPEHLGLIFDDDAEREAFEKTMRLGEVYLLPARYIKSLASIDSGARKNVLKHAAQTHHGAFLTPEAYFRWKSDNQEFIDRYYSIRDEIFANWETILFEVADSHMANARAAYRREKSHTEATGKESKLIAQYTEAQFVSRYVDAILEAIPGPQEVYDSFSFIVDLAYIPLPSLIAEEQAQAEIEYARAEAEKAKTQAEVELQREVMANYKARVDELVVGHVKSLVSTLNETLYQAASDILATTQTNQRLHPRSVVQLRAAIERIKALNVLDYQDITKMVNQAEQILSASPESRTAAEVEAKLKDIVTVTRSTLIALDEMPERGRRMIEVAEVDPINEVRNARARLGLDLEPAPAAPQTRGQRAPQTGGARI